MATVLENLEAARLALSAKIAEVLASPKPDYNLDGQSFSYSAYYTMLTAQLKELDEAIVRAQGPYQVSSKGTF